MTLPKLINMKILFAILFISLIILVEYNYQKKEFYKRRKRWRRRRMRGRRWRRRRGRRWRRRRRWRRKSRKRKCKKRGNEEGNVSLYKQINSMIIHKNREALSFGHMGS